MSMEFTNEQVSSYKEAFALLKATLDKRVVNLDKKHYIIVPDDCTLMAEKLFFSQNGAFDAEVLTFNRLFNKLASAAHYLPRQGAVMLLKSVVKTLEGELKFFRRSAAFPGFCQKLYDTINALITSGIAPEDLAACGDKIGKLSDIKLIYERYLAASGGRFIDAAGRMELLYSKVKETDFSGVTFYFAGFNSFTYQQKNIIKAIEKTADAGVIYVANEPQKIFNSVEFYSSIDDADQLKTAAKRIRALIKNGARYGDIAIISPSLAFEKAKRILSEFDIPFFIDQKKILSEQSIARYFFSIQRILENGYRAADFIALSKNPFSRIDKTAADEFENYCLKFCIDYKRFAQPFTLCAFKSNDADASEKARLNTSERVRKSLMRQVESFDYLRSRVHTAKEFSVFVSKICDSLSAIPDIPDSQVKIEKMRAGAELLSIIHPVGEFDFCYLFDLFCEGLKSTVFSALPKYNDIIAVGGCSSFRAEKFKHIFVIDFCEGVIPPRKDDLELISDSDIDALRTSGIILEPKVSALNTTAVNDFLFSVTETQSVFLAYCENGAKRKSELYTFFVDAKNFSETDYTKENAFLYDPSCLSSLSLEKIAAACSAKSNAMEMLLISAGKSAAGEKGLSFASELNALFSNREYEKYINRAACGHSFLSVGRDLFFKDNKTNITQMQEYFLCPYAAFLKHSLKLSIREDGRLSPVDIGKFLHSAAEKFVAANAFDAPRESMRLIAVQLAEQEDKYLLEANSGVIERLIEEAVEIAPILARQITAGRFVPQLTEARFGGKENSVLKTVTLKAAEKEIELSGVIDRVDVCGNFARVIDYKSGSVGKTDFDYAGLFHGRKLQLLVYLAVLRKNGYIPVGGFYFPLSASWSDDGFSHRLKGLYSSEPEVITAMDTSLSFAGTKSGIINSKRKVAEKKSLSTEDFYTCNYSLDGYSLDALITYALEVMEKAANEIKEGCIIPSPFDGACAYCDYTAVCGMRNKVKDRPKVSVKAETIINVVRGGENE